MASSHFLVLISLGPKYGFNVILIGLTVLEDNLSAEAPLDRRSNTGRRTGRLESVDGASEIHEETA